MIVLVIVLMGFVLNCKTHANTYICVEEDPGVVANFHFGNPTIHASRDTDLGLVPSRTDAFPHCLPNGTLQNVFEPGNVPP